MKLQVGAARAEIEAAQNERIARFEADMAARLETAEARMTAKGDARLAAETQRIELVGGEVEQRMRSGVENLEEITRRVPAIAEERAAAVAAEQLAGSGERISAELASARGDLEGRIQHAFREVERRLHDEVARGAEAQVVERAQAQVTSQVERAVAELEARVGTQAERAESLKGEIEAEVARVREELEQQSAELSKRSIRSERKRLEEEGAAQIERVNGLLEAKQTELTAAIVGEAGSQSERVRSELAAGLQAAREQLERSHAGARGELEEVAREQSQEAVATALSGRIRDLEEQVDGMVTRKLGDAEEPPRRRGRGR